MSIMPIRFGNDNLPVPYQGGGNNQPNKPAALPVARPVNTPKPTPAAKGGKDPDVIDVEVIAVNGKPVKPPRSRAKLFGIIGAAIAALLLGTGIAVGPKLVGPGGSNTTVQPVLNQPGSNQGNGGVVPHPPVPGQGGDVQNPPPVAGKDVGTPPPIPDPGPDSSEGSPKELVPGQPGYTQYSDLPKVTKPVGRK